MWRDIRRAFRAVAIARIRLCLTLDEDACFTYGWRAFALPASQGTGRTRTRRAGEVYEEEHARHRASYTKNTGGAGVRARGARVADAQLIHGAILHLAAAACHNYGHFHIEVSIHRFAH